MAVTQLLDLSSPSISRRVAGSYRTGAVGVRIACAVLVLLGVSPCVAANDSPHKIVGSPGTADLPRIQLAQIPLAEAGGRLVQPEYRGRLDSRLLDAAIGIDPLPFLTSAIEHLNPNAEPLVSNRELAALPSIEERIWGDVVRQESVCGGDSRERITSTTQIPWRYTCKLVITTADNQVYAGTGWLVGPRCVITAGHVVHEGGPRGKWVKKIEVIPAMKGSVRPYGTLVSRSFYSVNGWIKNGNSTFDYGAIILPSKIGDRLGWFGFGSFSTPVIKNSVLNTAGFPVDKPFGTMWFMSGRPHAVLPTELQYYLDTHGGQSGSCIWRMTNGQRFAVGIHVRGGCPNEATRINDTVYRNILAWKRL